MDVQLARQHSGLGQDAAGRAAGISGSQFGRIERGELRHVTVEQLCRAGAAVGLRLSARFYPDGDPVRDIAQVRLLDRLRVRLPSGLSWRTEVPVNCAADLRSWDAQILSPGSRVAIEAETRIRDAQATWRRIAMKLRDDRTVDHVLVLVADTPMNRRAIGAVRELLRSEVPLDSRAVLAAIDRGRSPGASGIVFL